MENIREILELAVGRYGGNKAFRLKTGKGEYRDITYIRYYEEIRCLGEAFLGREFSGKRIVVIGKNSYNWYLANMATLTTGNITVPLDKELKYEEFESSLIRSEAEVIFYDKQEETGVLKALESGKTGIKYAFPLFKAEDRTDIFDLTVEGKELIDSGADKFSGVRIDPDIASFLIFTSGTTSQSKIVMLSQRNVVSNVVNTLASEPIYATDINIALLPYHHTFGLTCQLVILAAGACTVYCDGLKHIQQNFKEYKVSIFVGVPLLIETMYSRILKKAEKEGMTGRLKTMGRFVRVLGKAHIDIRRNVFKGVLEAFGGNLRMVILGAAAADPECIRGWHDFGVICLQGYGLTETSPVLAAERPDHRRPGSIGVPIEGVSMDIYDPDENGIGEIIARGENVMLGYYENEEATKACIYDGWFHTGDLGYRDKDGYFYITGRKKNVVVLKNGKNVFPEEIEQELNSLSYKEEAIVAGIPNDGDDRDPVVALKLVYNPEDFEGKTTEEIHKSIEADVEKINDKLPTYKRIKRVYITDEPMEKTSTQKIKRFVEIQKIIDAEKAGKAKKEKK